MSQGEFSSLYSKPDDSVDGTKSATDTASAKVISSPGKGLRLYITTIIVSNNSATDSEVQILDGDKVKMTIPAPKTSGAVITLPKALRLTENADLNFKAVIAGTTITVSAVGYKGA